MSTFIDGPAAGVSLNFRRAPIYLRVTDDGETWDVLDQLDDEPKESERLYCYWLPDEPIRGFIDGRDYRGPFVSGGYKFVDPQPSDEIMRDNVLWREWTNQQPAPDWWAKQNARKNR